jgi:hypothetical protein
LLAFLLVPLVAVPAAEAAKPPPGVQRLKFRYPIDRT